MEGWKRETKTSQNSCRFQTTHGAVNLSVSTGPTADVLRHSINDIRPDPVQSIAEIRIATLAVDTE
jgi:hypothetical protein